MADHLEFLRTVPGPPRPLAQPLGPVPPLDPIPARKGEPDPVGIQKSEYGKRLEIIGRERAAVIARMRRDHRHFVELEACAASLVDAMAQLERHRLAQNIEESGDER